MPPLPAEDTAQRRAVKLAALLLTVCALVLAVAFVALSSPSQAAPDSTRRPDYAEAVAAALAGASPEQGKQLIDEHTCAVCHVAGAGRVAPGFAGIAERAASRRPPLPAAQYLYESIVAPGAFLAEGYAKSMPANFAQRLSPAEIGHIVAYLLSMTGENAASAGAGRPTG